MQAKLTVLKGEKKVVCGREGTPSQDMPPPTPKSEWCVDCPEKRIQGHTGVGVAESIFDKGGVTSGSFHDLGRCTHR